MTHPNPERDTRVERSRLRRKIRAETSETLTDTEAPERIWLRPISEHRPLDSLYTVRDVAARRVNENSIEYVRANIAAAAMHDRCLAKVREMRDGWQEAFDVDVTGDHDEKIYYSQAAQEVMTALQFLTLEAEQEDHKL